MLTTNELELKSNLTLGKLESNAEAIRDFVLGKLEDYDPAKYVGRADEAKSDRATLNNAEKKLNAARLELERNYMEPFNKFKLTITETCKAIKQASSRLDDIVKAEDERERAEKFEKIQDYWNATGFTLLDITRVYNPKWTNKTSKLKDVFSDIDQIQNKIFQDLKLLENFPAEDIGLLKTVYLDTLDLTQAMAKADQLKHNREILAREKIEREQSATRKLLQQQVEEEDQDYKAGQLEDLASEALGLTIQEEQGEITEDYALVLHGPRQTLLMVRQFMTHHGVTYTKLEDKTGQQVYTPAN